MNTLLERHGQNAAGQMAVEEGCYAAAGLVASGDTAAGLLASGDTAADLVALADTAAEDNHTVLVAAGFAVR